jgi:hypothetical protein
MASTKAVAEADLWGLYLAVCIVHFASAMITIVTWAVGYLARCAVQ